MKERASLFQTRRFRRTEVVTTKYAHYGNQNEACGEIFLNTVTY